MRPRQRYNTFSTKYYAHLKDCMELTVTHKLFGQFFIIEILSLLNYNVNAERTIIITTVPSCLKESHYYEKERCCGFNQIPCR